MPCYNLRITQNEMSSFNFFIAVFYFSVRMHNSILFLIGIGLPPILAIVNSTDVNMSSGAHKHLSKECT